MKYILIVLLILFSILILKPRTAYSYSGFSVIESPVHSIEDIIDDILRDSHLESSMIREPLDLKNLRSALIKGALEKKEVLQSILEIKNQTLVSIPAMPIEAHEKEYFFVQVHLRALAQDYGYKEEFK